MGKVGNVSLYGGESEATDNLKTFGAMLKVLRDEAGLTQEALAEGLGYSLDHISKIERGARFPPRDLDKLAEDVLGPLAARLLKETRRSLTRKAGLASRFRHWAVIEKEAVTLYAYECRVVPGLLQPEPYIRAVFEAVLPPLVEGQIEERVTARLERQVVLEDRPNTCFSFVLEQALLERQMGGVEVTRILLDHLLEMGKRRNIEIQMMPLRAEHHGGSAGSIYLAETVDHKWLGYSEGQRSSNLISDLTDVGILQQRYRKLSSQALSHEATVDMVARMRGDL